MYTTSKCLLRIKQFVDSFFDDFYGYRLTILVKCKMGPKLTQVISGFMKRIFCIDCPAVRYHQG